MGTVGGVGGGVLGNKLCRGCNKTTKLISTIGGVLGGLWLGSTTGEFFDKRDRERQVKLIEDTLEKNKDYQTSTDTYKKSNWVNPNTGQKKCGCLKSSDPDENISTTTTTKCLSTKRH
jgi:hypothetical protein